MGNHFFEIMMYGGLSKSAYHYISTERHSYNCVSLTFLSFVSCATFVIMLILSSTFQEDASRGVYGLCLFVSLLLLVFSISKRRDNPILVDIAMLLFSTMLLGFGIYTSISQNSAERSDIFMVMLFTMPMLFAIRPLFSIGITACGEICYIVLLTSCFPESTRSTPVTDSVLFFVLGGILGVYFANTKIKGLYTDKRNKELLETDSLTKLFNRWSYENELTSLSGTLHAVVVLDVNNLKQTNDKLGHKAGDELICGAANCIRYTFSKYGKCFRTGGDEFVVLIFKEYESKEDVTDYFDRITSAWQGINVDSLSISYGFLEVTDQDRPIAEIIHEADALMYEQKRYYHEHLHSAKL